MLFFLGSFRSRFAEFNEIESFAGASTPPYSTSTWITGYDLPAGNVEIYANHATDSFADTAGLTVTRGRWFSKEDHGASYRPVVINERLSRTVLVTKTPSERISYETPGPETVVEPEHRVIGVITDFRKDGEFAILQNYMFLRQNLDDPASQPPQNILRVRPGTTAEFSEADVPNAGSGEGLVLEIEPVTDARGTPQDESLR